MSTQVSKSASFNASTSHSTPPALLPIPQNQRTKLTTSSTGGKKILTRVAGKDASKQFWKYHNEGILKKYKAQLQVGSLDTKKAAVPEPAPEPKKEVAKPAAKSSAVVSAPTEAAEDAEPLDPFGDLIPFGDPTWYQGVRSPLLYYATNTIGASMA